MKIYGGLAINLAISFACYRGLLDLLSPFLGFDVSRLVLSKVL